MLNSGQPGQATRPPVGRLFDQWVRQQWVRLQSLWRRRPAVVAAAGGVVVLAAALVIWANIADIDWTAVGAVGEWAAAVFAGLALIFAFRGWQAATATVELERQALELERARSEAERSQRRAERLEVLRRAEMVAAGLEVKEPRNYTSQNSEPPHLQRVTTIDMVNVSAEPFKAVTVEFFIDPGDDRPRTRDSRPLLRPGEKWSTTRAGDFPHCTVRYTDTSGLVWRRVAGVEEMPDIVVP